MFAPHCFLSPEPYDGTYACGFRSKSVRSTAAVKCSQCSATPVHWVCVAWTKFAVQGATCDSGTEQVQGVRRGEHLPAQSDKELVPGVRRGFLHKDGPMPPDLKEL